MFVGVRRRLALYYALAFSAALLLLGPALYLSFSQKLTDASVTELRLFAHRQALLAFVPRGTRLGINRRFRVPPPLDQRGTFYMLLDPNGHVRANPDQVSHRGLPDLRAARLAAHTEGGILSDLTTADAGDIQLYTVPILHDDRVVALLQAGHSLATLADAQRNLLLLLVGLGAVAVAAGTVGGLLLTAQAMQPINAAFAAQKGFVADASHELRTPLTVIRTNAEVLLETGAVADPEDRALVEDIVAEAGHMGRLITDLLTLARLDAGVLSLDRSPVALATVVMTGCRQMARVAERRDVRLVAGTIAPLTVNGDEGRLQQVLLILLDNAISYNHARGLVEVTLGRDGQHAALKVRDTGPGIPAAELPHLFARFHRGRGAGTRAEGSGLGLAIAAAIVRAHNGRVDVRSTPGKGSCFSVLLPLAARPDADKSARRGAASRESRVGSRA